MRRILRSAVDSKPCSSAGADPVQEIVERAALPTGEGDETPAVFFHQAFLVQLPSLAEAERLAPFRLTLELPTCLQP